MLSSGLSKCSINTQRHVTPNYNSIMIDISIIILFIRISNIDIANIALLVSFIIVFKIDALFVIYDESTTIPALFFHS